MSGDVGVSPGISITNLPDESVGGDIHLADAVAAAGQDAFTTAYANLSHRTANTEIIADLGDRRLLPGVYHSTGALSLTGTLALDAEGDPDAIFVFRTDAAFNTAAESTVMLLNGAKAGNVYWVVAGAADTGAGAEQVGNILALGAITLGEGTELIGRAFSTAAITLHGSTIRFTAALPPTIAVDDGSAAATQDTTPTISGTSTAPPSSRVTVRIAGQTLSTTVGVGGTWNVTAAALSAGTYAVAAKVRDAAGNGAGATQSLTVEVNPDAVILGAAGDFAVLAGTAITSTGTTLVSGDVGVDADTAVSLPPDDVNGTIHIHDAATAAAQADLAAALAELSERSAHTAITGDLGDRTFHLGLHHRSGGMALTGSVTLDAQGNPDAIFIFRTDAAFTTAAASSVVLAGGAQAANVYWVVADAVGTGAGTVLSGNIVAGGAITLGAGTVLTGRALSRVAVTFDESTITAPDPVGLARQRVATATTTSAASEPSENSGTAVTSTNPAVTSPSQAAPTTDAAPLTESIGPKAETTPETPTAATPATQAPLQQTPPERTPPEQTPQTSPAPVACAAPPETTAASTSAIASETSAGTGPSEQATPDETATMTSTAVACLPTQQETTVPSSSAVTSPAEQIGPAAPPREDATDGSDSAQPQSTGPAPGVAPWSAMRSAALIPTSRDRWRTPVRSPTRGSVSSVCWSPWQSAA